MPDPASTPEALAATAAADTSSSAPAEPPPLPAAEPPAAAVSTGPRRAAPAMRRNHRAQHNARSGNDSDSDDELAAPPPPALQWSYPGLSASASRRHLATVGAAHDFCISGWRLARALPPGARLASPPFHAAGAAYRLELFPRGTSDGDAAWLSVFLVSLSSPPLPGASVVLVTLSVLDRSGGGRHIDRGGGGGGGGGAALLPLMPPPGASAGVVAGFPRFVRAAALERRHKRYLVGDAVVVRATVEAVRSFEVAVGAGAGAAAVGVTCALPAPAPPPPQQQQCCCCHCCGPRARPPPPSWHDCRPPFGSGHPFYAM